MSGFFRNTGHTLGVTAPALAFFGLGLLSQDAHAAFSYPGCRDVTEADFKYQALVGNSATVSGLKGGAIAKTLAVDATFSDPIHMAFDLQANNKANVYWIERKGRIKLFDATSATVTTVGSIPVNTGNDGGLTGITLDPDFKTNKNLFLFYTSSSPNEFHLSRFTLNAQGKLDNASEKILMRFPTNGQNHTGGAMQFDSYGDLWVTVGKNAHDYPDSYSETNQGNSTEATAANLNDYRGGVIRIHPTPDGKYTIPEGNFGQYFSKYFADKGNAELAADYVNPAKVKQEMYVKGTRNAYSISVHKTQRVLAWGEFGINTNGTFSEEHNLVTHPIFGGYPYFAGGFGTGAGTGYYACWSGAGASVYKAAHGDLAQSASGPVNESKWNTGPKQLPPVSPAADTYKHAPWAGAVTGPIYQWSEASAKSGIGFPPHFDNAWFVTDWEQQPASASTTEYKGIRIFKMNSAWDQKVDSLYWFKDLGWKNPISFDQGPDGALYVLMYYCGISFSCGDPGTHLGRLEYTGPACAGATGLANPASRPRPGNGLKVDLRTLEVLATEPSNVSISDSRGRRVFSIDQRGPARYDLGESLRGRKGVYLITLRSGLGIQTVKVANL